PGGEPACARRLDHRVQRAAAGPRLGVIQRMNRHGLTLMEALIGLVIALSICGLLMCLESRIARLREGIDGHLAAEADEAALCRHLERDLTVAVRATASQADLGLIAQTGPARMEGDRLETPVSAIAYHFDARSG